MAPVVKQETADPTATPGSSSRLSRADTDYQVADPGAGAYDDQGMAEYGDEYGYEDEMEYGEGVDPGQAKGKMRIAIYCSNFYLQTFARSKTNCMLQMKTTVCVFL